MKREIVKGIPSSTQSNIAPISETLVDKKECLT